MILDRTHFYWAATTSFLALVATALYWLAVSHSPTPPTGGSWQGMMFGVAGTACMIYAGLLAGRKTVPKWQIGRAQTWLKGHIWVGLLSVPLILFHCGFKWGGLLEQALLWTLITVILSGVFGLALQQVLPRLLSTTAPAQAIAPQVDVACQKLRRATEITVQRTCGPAFMDYLTTSQPTAGFSAERELTAFYWEHLAGFLDPGDNRRHVLANPTLAAARFARLKDSVPEQMRDVVDELHLACDERRQLLVQTRIQGWLQGWLCIHVPLSVTLLVLGLLHVVMSVYY
ncbi:MAG: hypothetical protein JSS49_05145 [Planctomycetes bacterium]|nr:hypothetical protein [Planctomycetota bacterium]